MHDIYMVATGVGIGGIVGLLFMLAGGWLHHRGVIAGKGGNDQFVGNPKGDVFRIETPGEFKAEEPEDDKNLARIMDRMNIFKKSMGAK